MHVVLGVDRGTQAKESNRRLASYKTGRKKVTDVLGKKKKGHIAVQVQRETTYYSIHY